MQRDGDVSSISCPSAGDCLAGGGATESIGEYCFIGAAFVIGERAGRWGSVMFIAGLRKLEHYGDPQIAGSWIDSVACPSVGNCAVGGGYTDKGGKTHGFVAVERNGRWGTATQLPGLAGLNTSGDAEVNSVACGSPGSCVAHDQGFVVTQTR